MKEVKKLLVVITCVFIDKDEVPLNVLAELFVSFIDLFSLFEYDYRPGEDEICFIKYVK